ncbi:MAG TPA: hypothetical protein PLO67_15030 [Saprospiraceae bacterium]|nr:hypothetical protein [Saprospiraceae bacterium]HPI08996.1 hypothetical protein [Saprospiraceae bacterium]
MQVFEVIKMLETAEIRDMRIILRSDWFNYRADVRQLFEILVRAAASGEGSMPDKAVIFKKIYPEKELDDRLLRLLGSWLTDVIEDYLRWKSMHANPVGGYMVLASAYRKKNLPGLFQKNIRLAQERLEQQPIRNADYLRQKHDALAEKFRFEAATKRTEALNVQGMSDALDHWFFAQKLRQICTALSHQNVFKTEYKFSLLGVILEQIEHENLLQYPAIDLYYHCYVVLSEPDNEAGFARFLEKIVEHGACFPEEELRDLYVLGLNFCTRRINEGSQAHVRAGFELYRAGFEKKIFLVDGVLSRFTYRNAAALGLLLGELEWVRTFLEEFRAFIEPRYRDSNYYFSLARWEYEMKNYDAALLLLQHSESDDLLAALASKTLAAKILFNIGAFDALHSHLDAMQIFLKRHKEISYHRANYVNFIRFTRKLVTASAGQKVELRTAILHEKSVSEKKWLLEKVDE